MNRRAFRVRRKPNAQADRRPSRRLGVEMGELRQSFVALAFERIDPQIERRTACERSAFCGPLVAKHARKMRLKPIRVVAQNVGRRISERAAGERLALGLRQLLRREARAAAQRRNLLDIETALAMQHADEHRARAGPTHQPRRRRFAAQCIVDQPGNRGAIRRAGEPMRETPILERVGSRTSPRFEVGNHLDRSRKTSGRRHAGAPRPAGLISSPAPPPLCAGRRQYRVGVRWHPVRGRA